MTGIMVNTSKVYFVSIIHTLSATTHEFDFGASLRGTGGGRGIEKMVPPSVVAS